MEKEKGEMMKYFMILVTLLFIGCGTIKETTTTETLAQEIPAVVIHDTTFVAVPYEVQIINGIDIDSAKRDYFVKNCKGTMNIDKDGMKATISFLSKDNKGKAETIVQLTSEIEKKKQEIEGTKKTTETKSTPSDWWIFIASAKFWIPAIFFGLIIGVIGVIVLRMKTTLLKFIP